MKFFPFDRREYLFRAVDQQADGRIDIRFLPDNINASGDRMYDIRRWNRIGEIPEARGMSEDDITFYPIPQAEINLNGSLR